MTWWMSGMVRLVAGYLIASLAPPLSLSIRRLAPPGGPQRCNSSRPRQSLPDGSDRLLASLTPDGSPTAARTTGTILLGQRFEGRRLNT